MADAAGDPTITARHVADLVGHTPIGTIRRGRQTGARGGVPDRRPIADIVEQSREPRQVSDASELGAVVDRVLAENEDAAAKFRAGNEGVLGFLVGQVMKASGGSARTRRSRRRPSASGSPGEARRARRSHAEPRPGRQPRDSVTAAIFAGITHPPKRMGASTTRSIATLPPHERGGDSLLAVSLADSVFFSILVGEAQKAASSRTSPSRCSRSRSPDRCSSCRSTASGLAA